MARVIEEFPRRPSTQLLPWSDWLDGRVWELTQGEDFDEPVEKMRVAARRAANIRNTGITTDVCGNKLYIQAVPKRTQKRYAKGPSPTAKYPWDDWLNGQIWLLVQGRDFSPRMERMRTIIQNRGRRQGVYVRTSVNGKELTVQAQREGV